MTEAAAAGSTPKVRMPVVGDTVGGCRLTGIVGEGAMSVVYRGFEVDLEVERAIKVLKPSQSASVRRKFDAEAKIAAKLDHPNVVQVHGSGIWEGGLPFIKFEFVDGKSLRDVLKAQRTIPCAAALSVIISVCKGLEFARRQTFTIWGSTGAGIVHCDLKPENILVARQGIVKVTDFGVAQTGGDLDGASLGTTPYMCPEQHEDKPVQPSGDVFALGIILYEMLCGSRPFPGEDLYVMIRRKSQGEYAPVRESASATPREVGEIVERCLQPLPDKRYSVYESLQHACEQALSAITPLAPDDLTRSLVRNPAGIKALVHGSRQSRPRLRRLLATVASGLVLIVAVAAAALFAARRRHRTLPVVETGIAPPVTSPQDKDSAEDISSGPPPVSRNGAAESRKSLSPISQSRKIPSQVIDAQPQKAPVEPVSDTVSPYADARAAYARRDYAACIAVMPSLLAMEFPVPAKDSLAIMLLESYYMTSAFDRAVALGRETAVRDARYFMVLALVHEALEDQGNAQALFEKSAVAPSIMGEASRAEALLQRARFHSRRFEAVRSDQLRRAMIGAWQDVQREFCVSGGRECAEAESVLRNYAGE